jgi:hypothetical protein
MGRREGNGHQAPTAAGISGPIGNRLCII